MSGTKPFYFGNLVKADYVPAPNTDMDASSIGQSEQIDYFDGGSFVAEGAGTHREFNMNWGVQEKSAMDFLNDYRNGIHGKGLLYFVDPFAKNVLPPHWARPELACEGWPSHVSATLRPTKVAAAAITNLVTNPSMETAAAPVTIRTNETVNPRFQSNVTGWTTISRFTLSWEAGRGKATVNTGGAVANDLVVYETVATAYTAGQIKSGRMEVWNTTGAAKTLRLAFLAYNSGGTNIPGTVFGNTVTVAAGASAVLTVEGAVLSDVTTASYRLALYTTGALLAGDVIHVDRAQTETSTVTREYFDGGTLTTNRAIGPRGTSALAWFANNGSVHKVTRSVPITDHPLGITTAVTSQWIQGAAPNPTIASFYNIDGLGVGAAGNRMGGVWVKVDAAGYEVAANQNWNPVQLVQDTWTWVTTNGYFSGAYTGIQVNKTDLTAVPANVTAYFTGLVIHEHIMPTHFYDADMQDFSYAWIGTADASNSIQTGLGVQGYVGLSGAAAVVQSSTWAKSGGKSLRVVPMATTAGANWAYASTNILVDNGALKALTPGKTYTFLATARIDRVLPAGAVRAMLLAVSATTGNVVMQSAAYPNAPGAYPVRMIATIPGAATTGTLRLYNGAQTGGGDVWWDDLMVVEGEYDGPYFDGTTVFTSGEKGVWDGAPNASTSHVARTMGTTPNRGAQYTINIQPYAIPDRKMTLLVPPDKDLWFGVAGTLSNGAMLMAQPVYVDGTYAPARQVFVLSPTGSTRLNTKFSGAEFRAVQFYWTSSTPGESTFIFSAGKAVYANPNETPNTNGPYVEGDGHTGFRFNGNPTMAYIQAADGHQYVTTTANFTEIGAWA